MLHVQSVCLSITTSIHIACAFVVILDLNTQTTVHSVIITCDSITSIRESKISDWRRHEL